MRVRLPSSDSMRLATLCLVAVSSFFPLGLNRESRQAVSDVASLRRELDAVRAASASNSVAVLSAIASFRDTYSAPRPAAVVSPDGDTMRGGRGASGGLVGRYFRAGSRDGAYLAGHSYYCGDLTPWGVLDTAFPGGVCIDGVLYQLSAARDSEL